MLSHNSIAVCQTCRRSLTSLKSPNIANGPGSCGCGKKIGFCGALRAMVAKDIAAVRLARLQHYWSRAPNNI